MQKATDVVVDTLVQAGIDHVFGMPGGATIFLFDALADRQDEIRTVLSRHEGGASCMADMYGRLTGKPGVVIAQGAWIGSNAAFGIMEAALAGSPMLIFADLSDYAGLNQFAPYQCVGGEYGSIDLPSIMRSMTKYTTVVNTPDEFVHGTRLAIKHATTGRPGPACVLFRWNVALSQMDPEKASPRLYPLEGHLRVSVPSVSWEDAEKVADLLLRAEDPVMVIGRGVHVSRAYDEVTGLAESVGMPVATTYMGKSGIAETHDLAVGTIGAVGQKTANEKVAGADLLLAVGTCLAPDNTKMLSPDLINPERQKIVQIDIEPLHAGWMFPVTMGITSDAKLALAAVLDVIRTRSPKIDVKARVQALNELKAARNFFSSEASDSEASPVMPERIIRELNKMVGSDDLVVLDCGNNRMFMANLFQSKKAGQVVAPGGVAGVGWGVPAALGAQLICPDRRVVGVCGDGGMMMMLYTLEMARQYEVPINYVVINNACLANVLDYQAPGRAIATEYPETDFAGIARSIGCVGIKVEHPSELEPALEDATRSESPAVVDVSASRQQHFVLMS
jgi:acetolactate synthase-1/2/3 large subunit